MAEYERAKQVFDEHTRHKAAINDVDRQILHNEIGIIERYEMQKHRRFTTIELHVLLLGDVVFATNPFELFLDYGNQIKARSLAAQTFLIQLACGSEAYLPTKKAEKGGHYSAYIGSGTVGHEGGGILVEKTIDMINALFQSLGMEAAR